MGWDGIHNTRFPAGGGRVLRRRARPVEFLLVNTRRHKWTFPKGDPDYLSLTERQPSAKLGEAGVQGALDSRNLCLYIHPKVFSGSRREYASTLSRLFCSKSGARKVLKRPRAIPRGSALTRPKTLARP